MKMHELSAQALASALQKGELSAVDIASAYCDRIEAVDGQMGAYITRSPELALEQARAADAMRRESAEKVPPLLGVPVSVKDNICTDGLRTTCASRTLAHFVPPYDASVIRRLKAAGMPILGKTNLDEFAMGSSTETSAFGPTRNPWDPSRVPGGSSGGSAAAVAAGLAPLALGSDTGGSIRQPASFCGVVGMKPTYGRVSRFGLVAYASSLDQIGPLARNVADCALLFDLIAGHDPHDATSLPEPSPAVAERLERDPKGLRIGLPAEYFGEGVAEHVRAAVRDAVRRLEQLGAEVVELSLPHTEYALAAYYVIAPAEASSNLARYDGVRYGHRSDDAPDVVTMFSNSRSEGFGPEVKRRIMLGTYALSAGYYDAYYLQAQKVRTLIRRDFEAAFDQCDVLITPTAPTGPFRLGEHTDDPLSMYQADVCTIPVNLAGLPAITLPCGQDPDGMPMGLQVIAPPLAEQRLFQTAYMVERIVGPLPAGPSLEVSRHG